MLPTPTVSQVRAAQPASRRLRQDAGSQHTSESYVTTLDIPSPTAPHHHPGSQEGARGTARGGPVTVATVRSRAVVLRSPIASLPLCLMHTPALPQARIYGKGQRL